MAISAGYTWDIDRTLCTALKQHKGKNLFTRDWENIKPGRLHFGHNNFCDDCLQETPTKLLRHPEPTMFISGQNQSGMNVAKF